MSKRIVVDTSTGCLDYYEHPHDIRTIRIKIDINGELCKDGEDIKAKEFYDFLIANPDYIPKTTQPSVGELMEFFDDLVIQGYDEIIVITLSAKLSGTYNGVFQCASMMEDRVKIIPFDSKTVCFSEGYFALTAAKMIEENKTTEQIIKQLEHMRDNNKIMFAVDSLDYLVKNGRLSGAAGFIGKYLKIKPILEVQEDGTIQAVEKIRTTKKALEGVCERLNEYTKGHKYFAYIALTGDSLEQYLRDSLKEICGIEEIMSAPCTPVVGCHIGPNGIGIGIFLLD